MPCDPDTLNDAAKCLIGLSERQLLAALVYLVCNGGGGGINAMQIYTGAAPPAAPINPAIGALFYPDGGGAVQQWDTATAAWI